MTTTETDRIELHNELAEAIGPVATKLMQHLPPDWKQLATKTDLANLGTELRGEIAGLRGEITGLRGEVTGLRGEVTGEITGLRGEMVAMEGRIARQIAKFALPIMLTVLGLTVTLIISGALTGAA